jgi:hypothetical protein
MKRELGIARCGLACCLCSENVTCKGCRQDGFLELSWCKDADWCENRNCCIAKDLDACWTCSDSSCRKGLFAEKIKALAFTEYARRFGVEELLDRLEANEKAGIVYHRTGIMGDYDDFDDVEELIDFIRTGKKDKMKKYIAYCGLDCEVCEARIATEKNDDEMRKRVAKEWSELNHTEITPEMISCTGCRLEGVKTPYCDFICPIRQCALSKGYETCADCKEMESCEKVAAILANNPDAVNNLKMKYSD